MAEMEFAAGEMQTKQAAGGGEDRIMGEERKNGIDVERFGCFVASLRREKGMTQKQLAEKLFLSNKAVSKWENGLGMPDIGVLEPLAEILEVSVTELLRGERSREDDRREEWTQVQLGQMMQESRQLAEENRRIRREKRKKFLGMYVLELFLAVLETAFLVLFGGRFKITMEDILLDLLLVEWMPLFFGIWFFFVIREKLPAYYDTNRISFYGDGVFRMNMAVGGLCFNNRNWPHIIKALRGWCFWTPILYPALYFVLRLAVPAEIWNMIFFRLSAILLPTLGGIFVPVYVLGKKYQ